MAIKSIDLTAMLFCALFKLTNIFDFFLKPIDFI